MMGDVPCPLSKDVVKLHIYRLIAIANRDLVAPWQIPLRRLPVIKCQGESDGGAFYHLDLPKDRSSNHILLTVSFSAFTGGK